MLAVHCLGGHCSQSRAPAVLLWQSCSDPSSVWQRRAARAVAAAAAPMLSPGAETAITRRGLASPLPAVWRLAGAPEEAQVVGDQPQPAAVVSHDAAASNLLEIAALVPALGAAPTAALVADAVLAAPAVAAAGAAAAPAAPAAPEPVKMARFSVEVLQRQQSSATSATLVPADPAAAGAGAAAADAAVSGPGCGPSARVLARRLQRRCCLRRVLLVLTHLRCPVGHSLFSAAAAAVTKPSTARCRW